MYVSKSCMVTLFCFCFLPVPTQSAPDSLGIGDPDLRSLHLRPEHHHCFHAAPQKELSLSLTSLTQCD